MDREEGETTADQNKMSGTPDVVETGRKPVGSGKGAEQAWPCGLSCSHRVGGGGIWRDRVCGEPGGW